MELIFTIITLTLICVVLTAIDYIWKPKDGNILPYRVPIIGHIPLLLFYGGDMHKTLAYWATKTGYESFTLQIFNTEVVVLNSYDAIYQALVTKGNELGGRFKLFRFNIAFGGLNVSGGDYSPVWKKKRKLMHSHLKQYGDGIKQFENIAQDVCQNLINAITRKTVKNKAICVQEDVNEAFTNMMLAIVVGKKYNHNNATYTKWQRVAHLLNNDIASLNNGLELDLFPWLRHFGNSTYTNILEFISTTKELCTGIKQDYYERSSSKEELGLAHSLFDDMNSSDIDFLDENVIRLLITELLGAGVLTSSRVFYAFLQLMAIHPEIQKNIYDEITTITEKNNSHLITINDRENMPYTQACMIELQRYVTIAPLGVPHLALTDTTIIGHKVKKGSMIVTNLWQLHHNSHYWTDPWEFLPERFLDDNQIVASDHINRKHMMAFGAGTRACLGLTLAKTRLFLFCTTILQKFEIKPADDVDGTDFHDPRTYKVEVVLTPKSQALQFVSRL